MRTILYIIAVMMVIGWLIGAVFYAIGGLIHLLLVVAVAAVLFSILSGRNQVA